MLNSQLKTQLMLDTGPLGSIGLAHGSELGSSHMQHHLQARDAEKETLLHRLSEMEAVLQQQQQQSQAQQQTITRLQAQIILLEERYRLTSDGADQLQDECLSHQTGAFRQGTDVELAAAHSALSPAALRSAVSMAGASAFAAAAAGSSVTSVLETSSSGGSTSTTTAGPASSSVPSGGGDSSSSSAEGAGHGPWSQGAGFNAFGLNSAPSAPSHLATELPGGSLPMLQPSLDALVSPLPTSLSGLSRSLSLSATAGAKQQHKPRQPGGSAGGALLVDGSGNEEFVQVRRILAAVFIRQLCFTRATACQPTVPNRSFTLSVHTSCA